MAIILHFMAQNVKNQSAARFLTVAEVVLMILILRIVLSLAGSRVKLIGKKLKELVKKALGPIIAKIREISGRKRRFAKGEDEKKLVFNFNIIEKLKNKLKLRKKPDLKHSSSNMEKIRLLYIKLILKLIERHYKFKYSHTPEEIKNGISGENKDPLFAAYEKARYDDAGSVYISNETVKLCEEIIDTF